VNELISTAGPILGPGILLILVVLFVLGWRAVKRNGFPKDPYKRKLKAQDEAKRLDAMRIHDETHVG
jgi:hypothetical protein